MCEHEILRNEDFKGSAMRALALPLAALFALALSACGPQLGSGPGDDVDADPAQPDAHPGTGAGCQTTPQCQDRLVCDPQTNECSDSIACTEHGDCGASAHCASNGTCRKSSTGSPCDDESNCFGGDECFNGFCGCQGTSFTADPVPVNMHIVLDRSNSMQCHVVIHNDNNLDQVGYEDPNSRWQVARGALQQLFNAYDSSISFGLAVYPGLAQVTGVKESAACSTTGGNACNDATSTACSLPSTLEDVRSNAGSAILAEFDQIGPGGCTPSAAGLESQLGYAPLSDPEAENFILYITDGAENCGANSSFNQVTAIQSLRNQDPEVRTFVVGFTSAVNPDELDAAAVAGGMARDGSPRYYQANDAVSLEAALQEIGGRALSCSFTLDSTPPDLDDLFVYIGNQSIIRDTTQQNGWDFDPDTNRVTLYGGACDAAQASTDDVTILAGCPLDID
jgi:hypothetical protein